MNIKLCHNIGTKVELINRWLLQIKMPVSIGCAPCSLKHRNFWKGISTIISFCCILLCACLLNPLYSVCFFPFKQQVEILSTVLHSCDALRDAT